MNNKKNIFFLFTTFAYLIGFLSFVYFDNSTRHNYGIIFYFWFFIIFRDKLFEKINGQRLIFLIFLILLFLIPSIGIYFFHKKDLTHILFIFILCFDLLQKLFDKPINNNLIFKKKFLSKKDLIIYFTLCAWTIVGPFLYGQGNSLIGMLTFMIPYAIVLIYLEKIMKILTTPLYGFFFLFYHYAFVFIWYSNHWWGMGRLYLLFVLISPILIYFHHCKIFVSRLLVYILSPLVLFLLQIPRYKNVSLDDILIGSAGYHLTLTDIVYSTQYFIESKWRTFFDEYTLMYLISFPRDLWTSKPFPIGWWAVDIIFGRETVDKEFSISMGFIGENMLIFGEEFYIGLIFTIFNIIIIRKIIFYLSFRSIVPLIIFDLTLANYFWGGIAIFGARLWVPLIPVLLFLIFQNTYKVFIKKYF